MWVYNRWAGPCLKDFINSFLFNPQFKEQLTPHLLAATKVMYLAMFLGLFQVLTTSGGVYIYTNENILRFFKGFWYLFLNPISLNLSKIHYYLSRVIQYNWKCGGGSEIAHLYILWTSFGENHDLSISTILARSLKAFKVPPLVLALINTAVYIISISLTSDSQRAYVACGFPLPVLLMENRVGMSTLLTDDFFF